MAASKQQQIQRQQQSLLPQQIMMIKLLEVPAMELGDRIREEIEANPALEEGAVLSENADEMRDNQNIEEEGMEKTELEDDYDDDIPDYKLTARNYSPDDALAESPISAETSFHEFLSNQIDLSDLSAQDKRIAEYIVGNINDEGYLQRSAIDMADDILFQLGEDYPVEQIEQVISYIKTLEPAGVGAMSLQECLILQLQRKKQTPSVELAIKVLSDYFDEFSKRQYEKIARLSEMSEDNLKSAVAEIKKLTPKPGNSWGGNGIMERTSGYIVPDFLLENHEGELQLSLNERNTPSLRITGEYEEMLKKYADSKNNKEERKAAEFIRQKIDAANLFMEALRQRQVTLMVVMNAIVQRQKEYFLTGDEASLKPMIMKDVAEDTGLDVSTISRVSNSKYVQTEFGSFPLKFFFNEKANAENGDEVSTRKIKQILQRLIQEEDGKNPYSDDELSNILKQDGYVVARRTVAKYREQMNIQPARLRKELD